MCYIFDFADTHFGGNEMGLRSAVLRLLDRNQDIYMYIYMYIEGVVHGVLFEHVSKQKGGRYRYPECTVQTVIRVTVDIDI